MQVLWGAKINHQSEMYLAAELIFMEERNFMEFFMFFMDVLIAISIIGGTIVLVYANFGAALAFGLFAIFCLIFWIYIFYLFYKKMKDIW